MSQKKPVISKRTLRNIISDSKILEEKLREPTFRDAVEALLRTFSDKRLDLRFFEGSLSRLCGDKVTRLVGYLLHSNKRTVIDELRKTDISKEVVDFLAEIVAKFGQSFEHYKFAIDYPDDWRRVIWDDRYDMEREELILRLFVLKEEGETVTFEAPARSYLQLARILLNHIAVAHKKAKKDLPNLKPKFKKREIRRIRRAIEEIALDNV